MNKLILIISFLVFANSYAEEANVFCKSNKKIYSALTEQGHFKCSEALLIDGNACFTGDRAEVIELINGDKFNWDEEWIEDAHFKGKNEISYVSVDGPNEIREKLTLKRCTGDLLKK